ncbi:hypothetical protein [Paenibacillus wenxiniae]|uniref:Lipoprotein n=1 Tax=Paenibacillus wenxiniae TaxID=1636843 RepID=A0ABW4RNV8_9BACL
MMQRNIQSWIRRSPLALLLLMGILLLAACGNQAQQQPAAAPADTNGSTDTEMTTPQDTNETTPADNSSAGTGEESTASPETNTGTTSEGTTKGTTDTSTGDDAAATHVASGTFSGLADEHSAEIMVDGKPVVYQLTDSIADAAGKLKEGSEITFKYTEKPVPDDASTMVRTIVEMKAK